jgi:hypothetical protein
MKSHQSEHESRVRTRWQVSQCECGHLTLQLGMTRIEFTRAEFAQLERLNRRGAEAVWRGIQ